MTGDTDADDADGRTADVESRYDAFRRGERPDDVLIFLHETTVGSMDDLLEIGHRVDDGVVLVLPGEEGRSAFRRATGLDAMDFAGAAMGTDGEVRDDLSGGACPEADGPTDDHFAKFVFSFAEEQNVDVGGIYAEGPVVHAYAACDCGATFSEKWAAGQ